jgi:hypothetical protein
VKKIVEQQFILQYKKETVHEKHIDY